MGNPPPLSEDAIRKKGVGGDGIIGDAAHYGRGFEAVAAHPPSSVLIVSGKSFLEGLPRRHNRRGDAATCGNEAEIAP